VFFCNGVKKFRCEIGIFHPLKTTKKPDKDKSTSEPFTGRRFLSWYCLLMLTVDTSQLSARAARAPLTVRQQARNALSDAAFDLRKRTPDDLRRLVDSPTPATVRPGVAMVEKAQASDLNSVSAVVKLHPAQAAYLSRFEFQTDEDIHRPALKSARDTRGNLRKSVTLTSGAKSALLSKNASRGGGRKPVGKFFIGRLRDDASSAYGIWERHARGAKVRLVTKLLFGVRSRRRLGLLDAWESDAPALIRARFAEQLQRSPL